jgi:hypothetical protein
MELDEGFLLLGAGASRDGGVPTAQEFVGEIRKHLSKLPSQHREVLLAEFDLVVAKLTETLKEPPGLEPFFEALDDTLDAHYLGREQSTSGIRASRAIERIHYETKRVIQEQCDVRDPERASYLDPLMDVLRWRKGFSIASLNYDSLIELGCARSGLHFFEPEIEGNRGKGNIRLIKVHGSVTWLPTPGAKAIARSANYASSIMRQFSELRSAVLETPLIYPSRRKMPIHAPFMRNSLELQHLLATRKFCIAVGYSFPDLHIRSLLETAIKNNPQFLLYVVGPVSGNPVFRNLVCSMPNLPWTKCLRIVGMTFREFLRAGLMNCLDEAGAFGPQFRVSPDIGLVGGPMIRVLERSVSGMGASSDGSVLYVSDPSSASIVRIDIASKTKAVFAKRLKNPRGLAVATNGDVFVVQNRLLRWPRIPTIGAGTVLKISVDGKRQTLTRLSCREQLGLVRLLLRGTPWAELRDKFNAILSWPTDVAVRASDNRVFTTEARALVEVGETRKPVRVSVPPCAFNLHGVDACDDGGLVGVEQGVGQTFSWGRVERFDLGNPTNQISRSAALEGHMYLMAICYVPDRQEVVVSQTLSWPLGALLVLDYPGLNNVRVLRGFDFPQKLEFIRNRNLLAISSPGGIGLLPTGELDKAILLDTAGRCAPFFLV